MQLFFSFKAETKTCYRFETGERPEQMTLYLKKSQLEAAGITAKNGVTITIEEGKR